MALLLPNVMGSQPSSFGASLPPNCIEAVFNVTASAINYKFPDFNTDDPAQITKFIDSQIHGQNAPNPDETFPVSGTFQVSGAYCHPTVVIPGRSNILQFLLHGATYDHRYWFGPDFADNSWIKRASEAGYYSLALNRLGHDMNLPVPDAININQATLQVAVYHELIKSLRTKPILDRTFDRVACLSHSLGSHLITSIARQYPEDCDAIFVSGMSTQVPIPVPFGSLDLQPAAHVNLRFADLQLGNIAPRTEVSRTSAMYGGSFDSRVAEWDYSVQNTGVLAELYTQIVILGPTNFSGPVLLMNGEKDVTYCNPKFGTCEDNLRATTEFFFPQGQVKIYAVPDTGHSLNLHLAAPEAFKIILEWLDLFF